MGGGAVGKAGLFKAPPEIIQLDRGWAKSSGTPEGPAWLLCWQRQMMSLKRNHQRGRRPQTCHRRG